MARAGGSIADASSLHAALADGVEHLLANFPATLRSAGVTPQSAAAMLAGELGRLLALDAGVSVGPKPVATEKTP
jgi:hypothetical protein